MEKINFENFPSTNTPLNAENLNQMQENIETEINTLKTYSTEEKRIGTWINGKPLYRRVWQITQLTNIENAGITEIEDVVSITGQVKVYDSWKPAQAFYPSEDISIFGWSIYNVNVFTNTFELVFGSWYIDNPTNFHKGYIILEYTKTTD